MPTESLKADDPIRARLERLRGNIERVFFGKSAAVSQVLIGVISRGHILIEDVPGVGKTVLARALARSLDLSFARIQLTPDLLPSDILGVSIYDTVAGSFDFKKGPIFANIVLADEINRTTPRTQSALLEAMNEAQVSVDGRTFRLDLPFQVIATQNPFEFEGTYPLPESELDRFFLRLVIGYPPHDDERRILKDYVTMNSVDSLQPIMNVHEALELQEEAAKVAVDGAVADYILALVESTRHASGVDVGISPRGGLALYRSTQTRAMIEGRDYVLPDDVKEMCRPVFLHRLVCRSGRDRSGNGMAARALDEILRTVPVPV